MTGAADRSERRRRRREGLLIVFVAAAFLVLAVVQTQLPEFTNSASRAGNVIFFLLINLNVILLVLFLFLVARNLVKLVVERRQRILGARLRARLVMAFVTLTLFPTLLLFVVAEGFLSEAINNWFGVRVVSSVEGALKVAHRYYQRVGDDALHHAAEIGDEVRRLDLLAPDNRSRLQSFVEDERRHLNVQAVQVADHDGPLALAHDDGLEERALQVAGSDVDIAFQGLDFTATQKAVDGDLVRGGVPVHDIDGTVVAIVVVDYLVPRVVSQAARETVHAYDEYRQLGVLKQPIVNSYTLTLLLITLVVLLAAIWFGFTFAKGFTVPIQRLGDGMSEVAQGNLGYRAEAGGDEEFAPLFASFNTMAGELQTTHSKLDERRSYIENVLRNITAGVLSIDEAGVVAALNPAAGSMLTLDPIEVRGRPWREALAQDQLAPLRELLDEVTSSGGSDRIERQVKLAAGPRQLTAWVTAIHLKDETGAARGAILFLEDVSYLLRVERMEAWREVARRIAHEIKNPLTPIQLSAQRLQKRYGGVLDAENGALLQECTNTIVGQVEQLKRLVNEFSTFARLPAVEVAPNDLAAVVEEALVLFREGHGDVEFSLDVETGLPTVEIDPEAIKRVVVNLLDNAVAACQPVESPRVDVRIFHDRPLGVVRLEVADNGTGISPEARGRVFEPYFSTKADGTGLGLAIVAAIVAEHRAYIRVFENQPIGTRFAIDFPLRVDSTLATGLGA